MAEQKVNQDLGNAGSYVLPAMGEPQSNIGEKGSLSDKRKAEGKYSGGTEVNNGRNLAADAFIGNNQKGRGN